MSSLSCLRGSQACSNCLLASKPLICKLALLLLFLSHPPTHPFSLLCMSASVFLPVLYVCLCSVLPHLFSFTFLLSVFFPSLSAAVSFPWWCMSALKTTMLLTLRTEACSYTFLQSIAWAWLLKPSFLFYYLVEWAKELLVISPLGHFIHFVVLNDFTHNFHVKKKNRATMFHRKFHTVF